VRPNLRSDHAEPDLRALGRAVIVIVSAIAELERSLIIEREFAASTLAIRDAPQ